jgi:hypothetical protein
MITLSWMCNWSVQLPGSNTHFTDSLFVAVLSLLCIFPVSYTWSSKMCSSKFLCMISCVSRSVNDAFAILGYYAFPTPGQLSFLVSFSTSQACFHLFTVSAVTLASVPAYLLPFSLRTCHCPHLTLYNYTLSCCWRSSWAAWPLIMCPKGCAEPSVTTSQCCVISQKSKDLLNSCVHLCYCTYSKDSDIQLQIKHRIHWVLHTNKCTNFILYVSLKLFAPKHFRCSCMFR